MALGTSPYNGEQAGSWEGTPGAGAMPENAGWPQNFGMPSVFGLSGGEGASDAMRGPGPFTARVESAVSSLLPPKMENMNG